MTFLGEGSMANPCILGAVLPFQHSLGRIEYPMTIWVIDDIVEILEILFSYEIAKNIDITIGFRIGGKDIVIGNNHNLAGIPDLGVCTKYFQQRCHCSVLRRDILNNEPATSNGAHPTQGRFPTLKLGDDRRNCLWSSLDRFQTKLFPGARRLMELADGIEEVKVTCQYCQKKAICNLRFVNGSPTVVGPQIQLGADEHYAPVCWAHYDEATKHITAEVSGAVLRPS